METLQPNSNPKTAPRPSTSVAYEASRAAKAVPGVCYGVRGYNSGGVQFIQLHDAAALPANTAVPAIVFAIAATTNFTIDFGAYGRPFAVGIVACNSSTGPTLTVGGADCWFDVLYA